jgi:hypothetical protein
MQLTQGPRGQQTSMFWDRIELRRIFEEYSATLMVTALKYFLLIPFEALVLHAGLVLFDP